MAKGMLSLTVALLLSVMCTVEGQSASGAAAAGGGGGGAAASAATAGGGLGYGGGGYGGGGYGIPRYGGDGFLSSGYNGPQYGNSPYYTYLPPRYTSSNVVASKVAKTRSGLGIIDDILNHAINLKAFTNVNEVAKPASTPGIY